MREWKRIIAVVLSVLMLVTAIPLSESGVQAANISASEFQTRLASVKNRFKDGEYFSGNYGTGVNLTKTSSKLLCTGTNSLGTTCSNNGYCAGGGWCSCSCGTYYYGGSARTYQCWAFACQVGYDIFGIDSYGGWQTHRNANNIQPGDIIRFSWNTGYAPHSIFVTNVIGDTIYYADANYTGPCKVEWDHSKTRSQIAALLNNRTDSEFRIYHAPNNATTTSTTPSVSYATITTGKYYIKNNSTGTYLNVDGGTDTNTQNVSVASFTGGTSMQMEITSATNGYKIRPMCSSSRLVNPYADYVSSGVNVNIYNNVNDSSQWWGFEKVSSGYVIRNMQNQNCVLALNGTNVIVSTYTGAANQIWSLEPYDTYTISYNANGGSGAPSSQTKVHGIAVALSTTKPTRTGYKFLGWSTSSSATSVTYASGATYSANGNVTLYAVWEANTYTVTYNANGGTGAPSSQTKTYGVNLTLYAKEPTRSGYKFLGWGTSASATSTTYEPGGTYTKNESITLYAVWQKNTYTTYFDSNGGTNSTYAVRQAGENITFPTYEPYREYHVFLGWADSATSNTAQYTLGQTIEASDGDKTYYAVWKAPTVMEDGVEYTITFGAERVEKYFSFTPKKDGYYMVDETVSTNCGEILWCDENGASSFESSLKYLKDDTTYYFKATNEWNYDGEGDVTLSVTYTPITHMEAIATQTVLPSIGKQYHWNHLEPVVTIYAGDSIYFKGTRTELISNTDLCGLDDNLYDITRWTVGTQLVEVYLGDLSCKMEVIVQESSIVSIEQVGENILIENVHGYYSSFDECFIYGLYYCDFNFVVTYGNGYTEQLNSDESSFNYVDPQTSENKWGIGTHTVICEYMGFSTEFKVKIVENPIESIEITEPIVLKGNECMEYSASGVFSRNQTQILKTHSPHVWIHYKNGTEEEVIIKNSWTYLNGDWFEVTFTDATIQIAYMNHTASTSIIVEDEEEVDPIVSGKVIELPEHIGEYPSNAFYDFCGTKIELTYQSGDAEILVLEDTGEYWWPTYQLSKYACKVTIKHVNSDTREQTVTLCIAGIEIPIITIQTTKEVEKFEFLTVPQNVQGEDSEILIYYTDGTTQKANTIQHDVHQGNGSTAWLGRMRTDAGFILDWDVRIEVVEHTSITYNYESLDNEIINAKILAFMAQRNFKKGVEFEKEQTNSNVEKIFRTAWEYYMWCNKGTISIEEAQEYVSNTFVINNLNLTKLAGYYEETDSVIAGTNGDDWGVAEIFTDQILLYSENENSWIFKCTDENKSIIYVEIQKSTNQILYIGDTYEIATLESISVASQPQKLNYYVGNTLDISGLQLQLSYSDGTTEVITEGFMLSEFDAYQVGIQTIIVTYEGMSATFNVSVEMPGITISSKEATLEIDGTVSLSAETTPSSQTITWTSSNENVATVTDGVVTAIAPGIATITAQFTYNGETYVDTCSITVNEPLPTVTNITVAMSPVKTTYIVGETLDTKGLSLRVDYDNGTSEIVSEGFTVSGYDASTIGIQTLEVTYADLTTNFTVIVSNPEINLSDSERTMVIGGTVQLRAETSPSEQVITWTSSDLSVATVENGLVTGVNSGTTIIAAAFTYNGVTYSKECTITVIASLTSIEIATNPSKTVYIVGEELDTTDLSIQLNYDDGTTKVVTDGFTTYGYDAGKVGTQVITVYYHGHASAYTVVVEVDENAPQIIVESKKNIAGKTVTVDIILKNNPGIASATLKLNFDTSVLTLTKVTDAGNLGIQCHKPEFTSPYTLSWMNDTATEDFTFNGTIVTLTFEIAEDAEIGDYAIDLSYDYDNYDIWNVNVEKVKFAVVDGVISVIDTIIGDVNGDGAVNTLDRMALARYLANWEGYSAETIDMIAADVNNDGIVNTLDRMALARHLANWSGYEALPCEI